MFNERAGDIEIELHGEGEAGWRDRSRDSIYVK
jgi:hypothetical protein